MVRNIVLVMFCGTVVASAQERFESGELKGFMKSATEHVITPLEEPFRVSSVQGVIVRQGTDEPLDSVVFEIRGPGPSERMKAARTNKTGHFSIAGVEQGTYIFKTTKEGFQSVTGSIVVSRKADRKSTIRIKLSLGV